jgi:transcriptional regulator with XRE-family HTH domain
VQGVVGARLRKARTDLGLSQAAFARELGFSSEFISLLESDKRAPSLAALKKIAAYLKEDLRDFLSHINSGSPENFGWLFSSNNKSKESLELRRNHF